MSTLDRGTPHPETPRVTWRHNEKHPQASGCRLRVPRPMPPGPPSRPVLCNESEHVGPHQTFSAGTSRLDSTRKHPGTPRRGAQQPPRNKGACRRQCNAHPQRGALRYPAPTTGTLPLQSWLGDGHPCCGNPAGMAAAGGGAAAAHTTFSVTIQEAAAVAEDMSAAAAAMRLCSLTQSGTGSRAWRAQVGLSLFVAL